MKFCSACGHAVVRRVPAHDDRERHVCLQCETVHYQNPRIVVGSLPVWEDRVLLCRRAIKPRLGYWTLPAGYMENGESTLEGARRETREEAGAEIEAPALYTLFDLPHISQVYMFYLAQLRDTQFAPGAESLEVELFEESRIPWQELAFPVVNLTLRYYFDDRRSGQFPVRAEALRPEHWMRPRPEAPPPD